MVGQMGSVSSGTLSSHVTGNSEGAVLTGGIDPASESKLARMESVAGGETSRVMSQAPVMKDLSSGGVELGRAEHLELVKEFHSLEGKWLLENRSEGGKWKRTAFNMERTTMLNYKCWDVNGGSGSNRIGREGCIVGFNIYREPGELEGEKGRWIGVLENISDQGDKIPYYLDIDTVELSDEGGDSNGESKIKTWLFRISRGFG